MEHGIARRHLSRALCLGFLAASLAACGGGGGGGGTAPPPPVNQPPTVDAGADQNVEQNTAVTLTGTASDDGGASGLTYSWSQLAGPSVTITTADQPTAGFTAPATADFVTLRFRLTVSDGARSTSDEVTVVVFDDLSAQKVGGAVSYEFVPFSGGGLDYDNIEQRPVRAATVQVIERANSTVLAEGVLDDSGRFLLDVPPNTEVFVRVRAELKRTGLPAWDVEVRDNTGSTGLPLAERPLYVLDGQPFDTGTGARSVTLVARTGWGGTSYTGVRAAAPFSILDAIYSAIELVLSADPDAEFAPLDAFWSVNNAPVGGTASNINDGEIGTSFYSSSIDSLFLLGAEDSDTEEFDTHVVTHEWGHYFEDNFSRSDSIGGRHTLTDTLDPRLAFGEGWGNAVAAMVLDDPIYFDTQGDGQSGGFRFDIEDNRPTAGGRGWYNERSIQAILYDLFDDAADLGDAVSLGFGPLYDVLVSEQATGVPYTTIYPFINGVRDRAPGDELAIDTLLAQQRISTSADAYGTGETLDAGGGDLVLPIYTEVVPGGPAVNVCSTNRYDPDEDGNKLSIRRFLRFTTPSAGDYTIDVVTTNPPASGASDPDFEIWRVGFVAIANGPDADRETLRLSLDAGEHVMEVYEFSYLRDGPAPITQPDDATCFDITISP